MSITKIERAGELAERADHVVEAIVEPVEPAILAAHGDRLCAHVDAGGVGGAEAERGEGHVRLDAQGQIAVIELDFGAIAVSEPPLGSIDAPSTFTTRRWS